MCGAAGNRGRASVYLGATKGETCMATKRRSRSSASAKKGKKSRPARQRARGAGKASSTRAAAAASASAAGATSAKKKSKGKKKAPPKKPTKTPTNVVLAWEDDPMALAATTPVQRPVPDLANRTLAIRIDGPRPAPKIYARGTAEFRYWAAAEALRRAADFWGSIVPTGFA